MIKFTPRQFSFLICWAIADAALWFGNIILWYPVLFLGGK